MQDEEGHTCFVHRMLMPQAVAARPRAAATCTHTCL